jgi:hypothetical protein
MDTLGPEKQFVVQRFPLVRGYSILCIAIYLDPQKQSVIEKFPLYPYTIAHKNQLIEVYRN